MELYNSIIDDYNALESENKENNDFYFNSYNIFEENKKIKDTMDTLNKIFNSNENTLNSKLNLKEKEEEDIFLNKKKKEKKFTINNEVKIEERFDYKLKKFKVKIGNHLIRTLKIYDKPLHIKFYKFNSIKLIQMLIIQTIKHG